MGGLRRGDWLHLAKQLRVGESTKVVHPDDLGARPSMTVSNHPDRWSAWCFRRNKGGVVFKDAVFSLTAPAQSTDLALPGDMVPIGDLQYHERQAIGRFIISKNVSDRYLPPLYYSESRQRLLLEVGPDTYMGRDLTEDSGAKWVNYRYVPHLIGGRGHILVLVEDPLSFYKLLYALQGTDHRPVALLGTRIRPQTMRELLKCGREAVVMLDGDAAGRRAAPKVARELRGFGIPASIVDLPDGDDPKDLQIGELNARVQGVSP